MSKSISDVPLAKAAESFLNQKIFAVYGLSRGQDETAKLIYDKLIESGRTAYAIHSQEKVVKGIICYNSLEDCPKTVDAIVVVTKPEHNEEILSAAKKARVPWVWLHKSFGNSVDPIAVEKGRADGLNVIDGACPMMFLAPVDGAHACFKHFLKWVGRIPRTIEVIESEAV